MLTLTSGDDDPADDAVPLPEPPTGPFWCTVCGKASSGLSEREGARRCPYCQNNLTFRFPARPRA